MDNCPLTLLGARSFKTCIKSCTFLKDDGCSIKKGIEEKNHKKWLDETKANELTQKDLNEMEVREVEKS